MVDIGGVDIIGFELAMKTGAGGATSPPGFFYQYSKVDEPWWLKFQWNAVKSRHIHQSSVARINLIANFRKSRQKTKIYPKIWKTPKNVEIVRMTS